ncbi:hypothetical protein [Peribacillus aracenensis]|uniref:hypothetical protein n=1 Tax=Peribacillus aracenensis TaxID=2976708 RepID=UPI0021A8B8CD|nr:hypothetical protein [Peribacillus sp. BBB004]
MLVQIGDDSYKTIGYSDNPIKFLESRLIDLVHRENFMPEFLVNSLLNFFSDNLKKSISERDNAIENNKLMLEKAEKLKVDPDGNKSTWKRIAFLESDDYLELAKMQQKTWHTIIQERFSDESRKRMEIEEIKESEMSFAERESFNNSMYKVRSRVSILVCALIMVSL